MTRGSPSRRRLLGGSLMALWASVLAACAPARTLAPGSGRSQVTPVITQTTAPSTGSAVGAGSTRSASTPAPVAVRPPVAPRAVPSPSPSPDGMGGRPGEPASAAVAVSGKRPYLTHPATSGTVRFLHGWSGPILSEIEAVVTVFGQAYPGVTVESESVASADLLDTLVTALASGAPPNAVMLRSDSTPYFADAGALAPLDTLLKRDGIRSSWFRARELSARTWEGQLYGLPHVSVGAEQLLYVNLALVERLGGDPAAPLATWTQALELVESARRLGAIILDPTRCGAGVLGLPVWTHTVGGRWIDDAGRTALWSEPSAVMAAEWMHQLVTAQRRDTVLPAVGARGAGPVSVAEWTQQLHVCAVNGAGWRARLVKEAPQLRIGVFGLPGADSVPADQRRTPSYGGWMLAIPRESRDQGAAWEWIKHLGVGDAADRLAKQQGRPSTLETGPSADRRGTPVDPVVEAAQASSVISPALPISARLDDLAADAQARLLTQRESPRAILEAAAQAGQQLLDAWHAGRRRTR